jgi:hypothetical protein
VPLSPPLSNVACGPDFDRAIIAHGELLDHDPKEAIREAWRWILNG